MKKNQLFIPILSSNTLKSDVNKKEGVDAYK